MTFDEILALIDRIDESSLSEVRVNDGEQTVLLRRGVDPSARVIAGAVPAAMAAQPDGGGRGPGDNGGAEAQGGAQPGTVPQGAPSAADDHAGELDLEQITSPIVGTFYRSPAPDSPPYVEVGTEVKEGNTLFIIEAMKVMNELEAEFDLRVESILVENGAMVEYGTPILEVRRV